jgi:catechol 2,3-dioxygenase-like lactoylglutathione lyase family enzyme
MIGIVVADMAASLRFYRLLDLEIPEAMDAESHVEVISHGYRLAWDTVGLATMVYGSWVEPQGHRIELAFRCDTPAEVDAKYAEILAQGYQGHKEPWDAFWGQRYAILLDPDGNLISLFAQRS